MQTLRAGRPFQRVVNSAAGIAALAVRYTSTVGEAAGTHVVNVRLNDTFSPGFSSFSFQVRLVAIDCCAISSNNRCGVWCNVCNNNFCQRLVACVCYSDLVVSIFADLLFFWTNFYQVYAAAANTCAPLAVHSVGIARCNNASVAYFAAFNSCEAHVDFLGFARCDAAKFEVQCAQAAAVFEAIRYVVCDNDIFSMCSCRGL